jgi:RES domain
MFPIKTIAKGAVLQHVSRELYRGTLPFFGRENNRYDDPARLYGVLYLAEDLNTALMESVFHNHQWARSKPKITLSEAGQRLVRIMGVLDSLKLADLTAPNVMAATLRLNLYQLSSRRYQRTQKISAQIFEQKDATGPSYDGLVFPSRNNHPAQCIALFDRAALKIILASDINLLDHVDWPAFKHDFGVTVSKK